MPGQQNAGDAQVLAIDVGWFAGTRTADTQVPGRARFATVTAECRC